LRSSSIVYNYFKKHWLRYVIGILIVILSTYLNTIIPKYLGLAIDGLNSKNINIKSVQNIAIFMGVISVLAFVTRFIWRYLILGFCRQIEFYLRENLFAHLQKLSVDYYVKNNTGDLITRAIVDVQAVRMMLGFAIVAIIDAVVTTVMSVINMSASTNPILTLLAVAPIPILLFIIVKVRLMVRNRYTKVQEAISNISSKVQENITGIRVMKAFSQEEKESVAFSELSQKKLNAEIKLARTFAVISPSVGLTFGIVFSIFLIVGGSMVAKHTITLGDYVSFNTYLLLIMAPIGNVGRIVERWQRGIASMRRLDSIFLAKPTIDDSKANPAITELETGEILAKNLSFAYETTYNIIKDLSFHVPSGGSIAIMGPTGCGKSTIAGLLTRVWGCDDDMLFIDGKNINTIPLKVLRESCAYVPQESFLFSDNIMENIRFYDKSITDEQVIAAAVAAHVHENIIDFPLGYNTVVGERGMTLSGGQKQRIALARALVRNPKILLLDDCMSAVDSATEKNIVENLKAQISHCTVVIVTHRLCAAALADTILLLNDDGSLAEIGSHSALMEKGGVYAKMVESMQSGDNLCQEDGDIHE
jgi:ATP-binding cassette subfamily B multidrug efflux pump